MLGAGKSWYDFYYHCEQPSVSICIDMFNYLFTFDEDIIQTCPVSGASSGFFYGPHVGRRSLESSLPHPMVFDCQVFWLVSCHDFCVACFFIYVIFYWSKRALANEIGIAGKICVAQDGIREGIRERYASVPFFKNLVPWKSVFFCVVLSAQNWLLLSYIQRTYLARSELTQLA